MKFFQKYSKWIIAFVFACAVIFVYKAFDNITHILSGVGNILSAFGPFFIGFIIAYIINMPAKGFNKLLKKSGNKFISKHSYVISVALAYVIVIAFVIILIAAVIPAIYKNVVEMYGNLPSYIRSLEQFVNRIEILKRLNIIGKDGLNIYSTVFGFMSNIDISEFGKYAQGVASVTSGIVDIFIALVASIYMMLDKERLISLAVRLMRFAFKSDTADHMLEHASRVNEIFINYIYSRLICGIITGIVSGIVLAILRVKYAFLLAILIALMDMIPYFGSIISCVVSALVTLITGGIWKAVWTAVALLIIQQLDGNVLAPKIMGETLEIRPLWIIFAVSVGGTLFGFWGMLISVPVIAVIKALLVEVMDIIEKRRAAALADANEENE